MIQSLPTNSPRAHYAVCDAALSAIRSFGTPEWARACQEFLRKQGSLAATYRMSRASSMIPIQLPDGRKLNLSPGKHNEVQVLVIKEFAPRFLRAGRLAYLGDTAKKDLYLDSELLTELGVTISQHDKLPDVVLLDSQRAWVVLVEVVTSHGPMTPSRVMELRSMFSTCPHGLVFVSVFQDFMEFRKHLTDIAWETEVWIAEIPDHLIHYNGDKFLGPKG